MFVLWHKLVMQMKTLLSLKRENGDLYEENITSHIWKIFCGCHGNHFTGVMAVCRIVAAQLQVYVCQFACACDSNHCCACNRQ